MVVPLQVLNQWRKEITSHTRLRVLVNHGSTRAASAAEFGDYDVVLTTYDTVLGDYKSGTDIIKSSRGKGKRPERVEQVTAKKRPLVSSGGEGEGWQPANCSNPCSTISSIALSLTRERSSRTKSQAGIKLVQPSKQLTSGS